MTDENRIWQGLPNNSSSLQTSAPSDSALVSGRYLHDVTKADFNRGVNVDVRSISGERVQARNYEIPEAIEINGDDNQEHSNDELIVDARPLPWYIRIDFWKLCMIAILIVSAFVVVIVLLSVNLSSSSTSGESLRNEPNDAPTSFPTYDITTLPTNKPSLKPSIQIDKEYVAMQRGVLEQYYIETDGQNSWYSTDNWLNDDVSICKWYGCECYDMDKDIVTSFSLQNFKSPQEVPTVKECCRS